MLCRVLGVVGLRAALEQAYGSCVGVVEGRGGQGAWRLHVLGLCKLSVGILSPCITYMAGSHFFALSCSAALGRCVGGVQLRAHVYALPMLLLQTDWAPSMMHCLSSKALSLISRPLQDSLLAERSLHQ